MSQDHLVRLEKWDPWQEPFAGDKLSVRNQNGILFLAECICELDKHGYPVEVFRDKCRFALDYLRIPGSYTFARRHGERVFMDSHDNMLGIVLLCQIFEFDDILTGIFQWGALNGWSFNNLDPFNELDIRAQRQPSAEALYVAAASGTPGVLELLWLVGSSLPLGGELRKLYLRLEIITRAYKRFNRPRVAIAYMLMSLMFKLRGGRAQLAKVAQDYYKDPDFPYRQLLQLPLD